MSQSGGRGGYGASSAEAAAPVAAGGAEGAPTNPLQQIVMQAMELPKKDREASIPAAVQTVLMGSADRRSAAQTLLKAVNAARMALPRSATNLLNRVVGELNRVIREAGEDANTDGTWSSREADSSDDDDDKTPFRLGPVLMPLAPLMNIASCLEPDDLSPAAASCKSLCIPININLQFMYFVVRLFRFIVLGPELAKQVSDFNDGVFYDSDSDSGADSDASTKAA
eukprot:TRINITY_DN42745_c0_g1_i1.p1 TRINITY_DN42745_c0_g1~~TRINITY_DN42745_c0_g1_i1.p1  ORF type:complete len:226 (+),score=52.38 TRINITY_DN42745_c0_g1_i1:95-772(+)